MSRVKPEIEIKYICSVIDKNIEANKILKDRGLLSENILSQIRNLTEDIAILMNNKENSLSLDCSYINVEDSMKYVSGVAKYKYINKFHKFLQSTVSHYTPNENDAERLMLHYFRYLCMFKETLASEYNLNVLEKLEDFPIYEDNLTKEHYKEICNKIEQVKDLTNKSLRRGRFYVNKCRPIYANGKLYYELTLTKATNYTNKFERILMYSKHYIPDNYSIKLSYVEKKVKVFSYNSKIKVIDNYVISIRPCEIKNYWHFFGKDMRIDDELFEYSSLMKLLKQNDMNILELVMEEDDQYNNYVKEIKGKAKNNNISDLLNLLHKRLKENLPGNNILRFCLVKMENVVIRDQQQEIQNTKIGNLYIKNQSIPFDSMPYAMSLYNHNVSWFHLNNAIDSTDREYEMFGRYIRNNAENNNILYTDRKDVESFGDVEELIRKYNVSLISNGIDPYGEKKIKIENSLLCIKSYEKNAMDIVNILKSYNEIPSNDILSYIRENRINCLRLDLTDDKKQAINDVFENSSAAIIHGPAGTGKTKMLEALTTILKDYKKIYLSNTTTSVENLRRRISEYDEENAIFKTTSSYIKYDRNNYDILIIDECSTVSNVEMIKILKKQEYKLIILSGDVYQIESIKYGNWFSLSYSIFKNDFVYELTKTNRTDDENLLELWKSIRDDSENAYDKICSNEYSADPNEEIFNRQFDDEIILCLNYDGLFGINNINRLLQEKNPNTEFNIGVDSYKIEDPIVFNDCPRFRNLYNNLKGIIKNIEFDEENDRTWFTILVDDRLHEEPFGYEILEYIEGKTLIKFYVNNFKDTNDDESGYEHIIPFNLSYAISIHKAQGLEYESVKIIITSNVEDKITKNIFYTAITRTKKHLKIFWTSESQKKIFDDMKKRKNSRDITLLKEKLNI